MTYSELTEYIQNYLTKNKTKSAIMLTGNWGIGKSHYIQHELVPAINENKGHCIIVSLYGLKHPSEISKAIFLEHHLNRHLKPLQIINKKSAIVKPIAKTIVQNVLNHFGFSFNFSETDWQEIYNSIDLSGNLIILEDIERSQIDILDLLGYVNSLVEQDGVKVLLVANEREITEYDEIEEKIPNEEQNEYQRKHGGTRIVRKPTEKTSAYLAIKEKTITDTILFECDFETAIKQIIGLFSNNLLNKFCNDQRAKDIITIMRTCNNYNLRSFMFACQKTVDIFEHMEHMKEEYEEDFIKCIFFGIISFSLKLKAGEIIHWGQSENYSTELGSDQFPLFKFCFDYIQEQTLDTSKISIAKDAFNKMKLYDRQKTKNDPDLRILCQYHLHYEPEVTKAIESISRRLDNPEDISFYDYGAIATYLIIVKHLFGFEIENIKSKLINNIKGRGNELNFEELFFTTLGDDNIEMKSEYEMFRKEVAQALKENLKIIPDFNYSPDKVDELYDFCVKQKRIFRSNRQFAKNLDMKRIADMFDKSTPQQKDTLRGVFITVYDRWSVQSFANDVDSIEELRDLIESNMEKSSGDKIQKIQYKWFIENLNNILKEIS